MSIGKIFSIFILALLISVFLGSSEIAGQENPFDYKRSEPLGVQEKSTIMRGRAKIVDLTYTSLKGGVVSAYLVMPESVSNGKHPGVVFQHWMMPERTNANRTEFLDEAVELAEKTGAVSLLIDAPMKREGFAPPADKPRGTADMTNITQAIIDIRRGVDVLFSRKEIDKNRLAYVGHSFGAAMGGILLGVEPRFNAFVLMASTFEVQKKISASQDPNFVKWRASFAEGEFENYLRITAPGDPARYVVKKRTAPVLLQYAKNDEFFSGEQDVVRAAQIVSEPKTVKIYEDGAHELNAEAKRDRIEWLIGQIGKNKNQTSETSVSFDYNRNASLDVRQVKTENKNGIHVADITYASPKGGSVTAYFVLPKGNGKFPAVIYQHWGMPGGNRDEFLPEAETMAKNGIASILIDAPFARPEPWRRNLGGSDDPAVFTQAVIDLRRAVDLLISRSEIDSERIAFVGHSFGANMGGILAGVEKRIKYFVLMAGLGNQAEFMRNSQTPELVQLRKSLPADAFAGYTKSIEPFAAENYVKNSAPADLFFQAATNDEGITRAESKSYYAAASNPKTIKFYEAKHALNADAERDRISWLKKKLGNK